MKRFFLAVTCILVGLLGTSPWQATAEDSCASGDKSKEPKAGTEAYVRHALLRNVSIDVTDRPLNAVVNELARQAKVPVEVHHGSLDAVGIDPDFLPNVTAKLHELPLRSCLRVILRELELTFKVDGGVVLITTPEHAEQRLVPAVVDVSDLLDLRKGDSIHDGDYDSIIEMITTTVAPTTWDEVGGPGSQYGFRGTIVFRQTEEVIEQVCQVLTAVRKGKKMTAKHGNAPPPVTSILAGTPSEAVHRVQIALGLKADFQFKDTPLKEATALLQEKYRIAIRLCKAALDAVGLGPETKVTFSPKSATLRTALRRLLDPLELTYFIHEGILTITTIEDAEQNLAIRVYPVQDLVEPIPWSSAKSGLGPTADEAAYMDYYGLIRLTGIMTGATTWDTTGGPGSIHELSAYGLLVISQTEEVHQEIERFYTRLRNTIPAAAKEPVKKPADDELRMAVYSVSGNPWGVKGKEHKHINPSEREVLNLITSIIEPESWRKRDDVYAHAIKERLIIRHTNAVHREIRELARKLEIWGFRETGVYKSDGFCVSIVPIVGNKTLRSSEPVRLKQEIKR